MEENARQFDFDWLVIGSGFGGSVSALRLAEKGYRVGVLECGRRFRDEDFARSTWSLRRYFWAPRVGMRGIMRLSTFKDIAVVSGCGVGGGSLGYANTLYVPPTPFFQDRQWGDLADWERELAPHYAEAQRMLGVVETPNDDPADQLLKELGEELGVGDTYRKTPVGIFFGEEPGKTVADPYFGGEGPDRTGCMQCGRCMVGCPHGAKNTLVKNYLWLAENRGVTVTPDRTVIDVSPLGAADGSDGYAVTSVASGMRRDRDRRTLTARGVVVAAGALGTNRLLQRCRLSGSLPRISHRLGELVRTNSESILAVTVPDDYPEDLTRRVAITSSIYPDPHTHIETVTYGHAGDSMSTLYTLLVADGSRVTRPLKLLGQILRHPGKVAKTISAPRLVAPHDHRARDADARQRDRAAADAHALRRGPAADRAGPEQTEPDVHPGCQRGGRVARETHRRDRAELGDGGDDEHPLDRTHPRRRGDRRRSRPRRRRRLAARLRLREPARLRRRCGARERRREPEPHDHRARRARDEPHPAGGRAARRGGPAGDGRRRVAKLVLARRD